MPSWVMNVEAVTAYHVDISYAYGGQWVENDRVSWTQLKLLAEGKTTHWHYVGSNPDWYDISGKGLRGERLEFSAYAWGRILLRAKIMLQKQGSLA